MHCISPLFRFTAFVRIKNGMIVETPVAATKVDVDDDQNNNANNLRVTILIGKNLQLT